MSGILDSKSRVMDVILTVEGRRQIAEGTFKPSYLTFTDLDVAYLPDEKEGHDDPTKKIYFEACSLPQDQIIFEANDEGNLVPLRSQDIKLKISDENIFSSMSQGTLINGKLISYQYYHGRRIKTSGIEEVKSDKNKGFIYSDSSGLTGSILIDPFISAGTITSSYPVMGQPYIAYVGTLGGMGQNQFAQMISGAIELLRLGGGPEVLSRTVNGSVYLDIEESLSNLKLFTTGTLSSPLIVEESAIGGNLLQDEIINANFATQIQGILTSSFDNFLDLRTISTIDRLFEDNQFELSNKNLEFNLSKIDTALQKSFKIPPEINSIDSIFSDDKMSHLENFMYLPPIVKTSDSTVPDKSKIENLTPYLLGEYPSWGENETKLSLLDLNKQLALYEQPAVISFKSTSNNNRVLGQLFEVNNDKVTKLDLIDFGKSSDGSDTNKIYFAGKAFLDNRSTACFINMFTIIFSKLSNFDEDQGA